jgi:hypothetical protein
LHLYDLRDFVGNTQVCTPHGENGGVFVVVDYNGELFTMTAASEYDALNHVFNIVGDRAVILPKTEKLPVKIEPITEFNDKPTHTFTKENK